jgi:hypothetical protein
VDQQIKVIATAFAFAGFAVALLAGLASQSPMVDVIVRAMVALVVCRLVGWGAGVIIARSAESGLTAYESARPIPQVDLDIIEVGDADIVGEEPTGSGDEKISQNLSEKGFG